MDLGLALLCSRSVTLGKAPNLSESLGWGGDDVHRAGHVVTDSTSRGACHLWCRPGESRDFQVGEPQGSSLASGGGGGSCKREDSAGASLQKTRKLPGGYSILTVTLLRKKIFLTSLSASSFVTCKGCPSYGYSEH